MVNTYLGWKYHIPMFITFVALWMVGGYVVAGYFSVIYLVIAWLFRHTSLSAENPVVDHCDIVMPYSGIIKRVSKADNIFIPENYSCIETEINFFEGYGIFAPRNIEVYDIVKNNKEVFLTMLSDLNEQFIMHFQSNFFNQLPQLWVHPGDRGKIGACIGYFPLGGKMFFYIPSKYNIKDNNNCVLLGGKHIVATPVKGDNFEKA